MKTRLLYVAAIWMGMLVVGHAAPLIVGRNKTVTFAVDGATAAFPLDNIYADASAQKGVVTFSGKNPGSTAVVVITASGTQTFAVTVPQPPPSYPPGFVKPLPAESSMENGS